MMMMKKLYVCCLCVSRKKAAKKWKFLCCRFVVFSLRGQSRVQDSRKTLSKPCTSPTKPGEKKFTLKINSFYDTHNHNLFILGFRATYTCGSIARKWIPQGSLFSIFFLHRIQTVSLSLMIPCATFCFPVAADQQQPAPPSYFHFSLM